MNRREFFHLTGAGMTVSYPGLRQYVTSVTGVTQASVFEPAAYGARGDGKALDSNAINAAINACHEAGGGMVYLRPGTYLSGTVVLKSNITLYLEAGAILLGSKDIRDYTPQPGPDPKADAGQNHLIFARNVENGSLQGPGCIDGQGRSFWVPTGRAAPSKEDLWKDVVTYDWKPVDRPSPMLEFVNCRNLHIRDLRIQNSAGWTMRYLNCDNVHLSGLAVKNPIIGPNSDGMDITNSQNFFVSDCLLEVADDVICLKSENPYGNSIPVTKNIVVNNCILSGCCNGFKIGTATRGGFENIVFSNSIIFNEDVKLNERIIAAIAIEMVDGGWIDGVTISSIRIQRARTPIFIRRGNRTPRRDGTPGPLKRISINDIHATDAILTSSITGIPGFPVEDVTLSNILIESEERGKAEWMNQPVPEEPEKYPEARMFGRLPSFGLYCRHIDGLRILNTALRAKKDEARPAIVCDDGSGIEIDGLRTSAATDKSATLEIIQCSDVWVRNCAAEADSRSFARLEGNKTANVLLSGCDFRHTRQPVTIGHDVPADAVTQAYNIENGSS